jgi:hypothetical protein
VATFLELVNDLERESGTFERAARTTTVAQAQTGEDRHENMVEWIREAWRIIQTARNDWRFMREEFEHLLVVGKQRYTPADLGITDFARWPRDGRLEKNRHNSFSIYDPAGQRSNERELTMADYQYWKSVYDRRVHDAQIPQIVSIDYKDNLCVGPTPDAAYMLRGEYFRSPQILELDGDVPKMPAHHHGLIVWRAMMLLGDHDESPTAVATGQAKYSAQMRRLLAETMEPIHI